MKKETFADVSVANFISANYIPVTIDSEGAYYKKRTIAKTIQRRKTDSLIFTYDLLLAKRTKNWKAYQKSAAESAETYYWQQPEKLKEIAMSPEKNTFDIVSLNYGLKSAQRSIAIKPSAENYLLSTHLSENNEHYKISFRFRKKQVSFRRIGI